MFFNSLFENIKEIFKETKEKEISNETNEEIINEELNKKFINNNNNNMKDSSQIYNDYITFKHNFQEQFYSNSNINYKDQNEMIINCTKIALTPEIDDALTEITSEAIVFDSEQNIIDIILDDLEISENIKNKIKKSFEKILNLLNFNEKGDEIFKQCFIDGVIYFENVYDNSKEAKGIQNIIPLSPFNLNKSVDKNNNTIFFYNHNVNQQNLIKSDQIYKEEQITHIHLGNYDSFNKYYISPLTKSIKAFNQLTLIEDSLVILRISRSIEKRAIFVDTGNLPKTKAEEYVKGLMQKYRQKKVYDPNTGSVEDSNKKISVLEDFWFPVASGINGQRGTRIESLAGSTPNFGGLEDLDYFINKVYRSLHIPISRRSSESVYSSGTDIVKEELKFFKFILKLRRKLNNLFIDFLKKDLIASNVFNEMDWKNIKEKIKFRYANSNEFSLLKKMQILDAKLTSASNAMSLLQDNIVSKMWIRKNILGLSQEEIEKILIEDAELEAALTSNSENDEEENTDLTNDDNQMSEVPSSWNMNIPDENSDSEDDTNIDTKVRKKK